MHEFVADPLNPRSYRDSESGQAVSYFVGPQAPPDRYTAHREDVARGVVATFEIDSRILGNRRKVTVYTPPGYAPSAPAPDLLLLFDRESYLDVIPTPTILDNMIADRAIAPVMAVLLSPIDDAVRERELPPNAAFQRFIAEELMPWLRARYRFSDDPARAVVAGSSFGALAASFTGFSHSELFGNVISQSGSYWWGPGRTDDGEDLLWEGSGWVARQFAASPRLPLRFYLDVGVWEGEGMLLPNRQLRSVLDAHGYDVTYNEVVGGHDYFNWRVTLPEGLIATLGRARP